MRLKSLLLAATCATAIAADGAYASLSIVPVLGGGAASGANYVNFDNFVLAGSPPVNTTGGASGGLTVSFNDDGGIVINSVSGKYAAPYLSGANGTFFGNPGVPGPDLTNYVTSGAKYPGPSPVESAAILTWSSPQQYLGILWGSVDTYNTLEFYNGATLVGTMTGSNVLAVPLGNQGINGTRYVNINSSLPFDKVVATSNGQYAFEFDNVAYGARQIPEAATIAVWSGLTLLGWAAYRRSSK